MTVAKKMHTVLPQIEAHAFNKIKPKKDVTSTPNRCPCAAIRVCMFIIKLLTMQLGGVHLMLL